MARQFLAEFLMIIAVLAIVLTLLLYRLMCVYRANVVPDVVMPIQVRPREANSFETLLGDSVTIQTICDRLSNPASQHLALRDLGVRISGTIFTVTFKERGFAYADPFGDRRLLEPTKSSKSFTVNVPLVLEPLYPLSVVVSPEPLVEDCVNYFGHISVNTPNLEKRFLKSLFFCL